jgi:hypothetical protein
LIEKQEVSYAYWHLHLSSYRFETDPIACATKENLQEWRDRVREWFFMGYNISE